MSGDPFGRRLLERVLFITQPTTACRAPPAETNGSSSKNPFLGRNQSPQGNIVGTVGHIKAHLPLYGRYRGRDEWRFPNVVMKRTVAVFLAVVCVLAQNVARGEGDWEITPQSDQALRRGLEWLDRNQGPEGNWDSNDLGLVSMGALAFMAAGHTPGVGRYGRTIERSLDYVLTKARPIGRSANSPSPSLLFNCADRRPRHV